MLQATGRRWDCLSLCILILFLYYIVKNMLYLILDYLCSHRLWGMQELWCFSLLNIFTLAGVHCCVTLLCYTTQFLWASLPFNRFFQISAYITEFLCYCCTFLCFVCYVFVFLYVFYNIRKRLSISHKWHDQHLRGASLPVLVPLCQADVIEMSLLQLISAVGWGEKCRADVSELFCWRKAQISDIRMMWASSMSHLELLPLRESKCTQRLSLRPSSS